MKINIEFELTDHNEQNDPNLPISIIEKQLIEYLKTILEWDFNDDFFIDVDENFNRYKINVLNK